jgi:DNA-binding MarR family transcriptional regulator
MPSNHSTPCHCSALRRASRTLTATYDRALAAAEITLPQFSLLRRLERAGPSSLTQLAEVAGLERSTLGRNLRPLEAAGWVESRSSDADARERIVALTAEGERVIARAAPLWRAAQDNVERRLGAQRLDSLRDLLDDIESMLP